MPPTCDQNPIPDVVVTTSLNSAGALATWSEPTASDTCGGVTLRSRTAAPGSFFQAGENQVTYTFADSSGNTVDCTFNVIVTRGMIFPFPRQHEYIGQTLVSHWRYWRWRSLVKPHWLNIGFPLAILVLASHRHPIMV